jgi:hypothetical protein
MRAAGQAANLPDQSGRRITRSIERQQRRQRKPP